MNDFIPDISTQSEKRILIVDDEPDMVETLKLWLGGEGFEISCAYDGVEALQSIKERAPDLIILDIMMPFLDGYAVLAMMKESIAFAHIPVIVLSVRSDKKDIELGRDIGASAYLTKPYAPESLLQEIQRCLSE